MNGRNSNGNLGYYYKEYFIYDATRALTAGTGSSFEDITIKVDSDANFEWIKSTYVATSDKIKIKARDSASGRYLIRDKTDIKSLAGRNTLAMGGSNSFMPFIWPRPYLVGAGSNFVVEAADNSNAANTFRLALHGAKIRPGVAPWDRKFRAQTPKIYSFSGGAVTVAASSTATARIEIDIAAHFLVQKVTGIRTSDATVTVTEGASGKDWVSAATHIDNLVGNGAFPNILPAYRYLEKGSVVLFNLTDLSGIVNIIEISLVGVELYE